MRQVSANTTPAAPRGSPICAPAKMQYRKLGRTGLDVSVIGIGSWVSYDYQIGVAQAKEIIQASYDQGVNFFDNAEVYAHGKSERIMGQALAELDLPRSDLVISTKVFFGATPNPKPTAKGLSRKHIIEGVKGSLQRLGLEYVDVVYAHRPDPTTPVEETVRAFNWVINQGWAFYWGTSEWPAEKIREAHEVADRLGLVGPTVEQPEYSLFQRCRIEEEYQPLFEDYGMGVTSYSPLACGLLTGKYSKGDAKVEGTRFSLERYKFLADRWMKDERIAAAGALIPIAEELGATPAQLALAWVASNPRISVVLTGATSMAQLQENLGALDVLPKLTPEVLARIDEATGSHKGIDWGRQ